MAITLKQFEAIPETVMVNNITDIINTKDIFDKFHMIDDDETIFSSIFNVGREASMIMFDCEDFNSAFLHEHYYSARFEKVLPKDFKCYHVKSNDFNKQFIKNWHKNIWGLPEDKLNLENKKYEIFIILIVNGEIYVKSDDFDIINKQTIVDALDIFIANK